VLWNFEKFLVDRSGAVVGRFAPDTPPDNPTIVAAIEAHIRQR
jgi:glutathione peroxidase